MQKENKTKQKQLYNSLTLIKVGILLTHKSRRYGLHYVEYTKLNSVFE